MPGLTFTHIKKPAYTDTFHTDPLLKKTRISGSEAVKPDNDESDGRGEAITRTHNVNTHALLFFTL